ncbi:MAG: AAA family ATPase [Candidatus Kaiserbacteria bacterium]|nr:AAA family ATPase [Candidatus Kaiserbacteria bacterium]
MFLSLKSIELNGFKSFGKKSELIFTSPISAIVGPNGSGKSNVAEGFRFVLGEQSMKSMRSKKGEDLIWGGSPGLARQGRGSVKVVFDNGKRLLDIDFDEVVIERVVYRDGQNEYLLNGTQVRLKDVIRLLAGANIGGSGYQIISQGEADRILNASPKERREMVEDALGLKLYQHKKAESERKLEETAQNIEKTKSLRREIAPHLNFLRVQVEKIEKAREMKDELAVKLNDYLARENAWITQEDARLLDEARSHEHDVRNLTERMQEARAKSKGGESSRITELQISLNNTDQKLTTARREAEKLSRDLGRAEGALESNTVTVEQIVAVPHVRQFAREVDVALADAEKKDDIVQVRGTLMHIRDRIRNFVDGLTGAAPVTNQEAKNLVEELTQALEAKRKEEEALAGEIARLRKEIAEAREAGFAAERDVVELEGQIREAQARLSASNANRANVAALRQRFEEEVREGVTLVGGAIANWKDAEIPQGALAEERSEQEKRRRAIERLKIKIEESGLGNGDEVVREFNQTKERDEFLTKELADLEASAASLKDIIAELEKTIDDKFKDGLKHINVALKNFFQKLFNGGDAKLEIEEPRRKTRGASYGAGPDGDDDEDIDDISEEEELYAGLSISVSLPRKKIRGLEVLSGGERALTSIALIFSMTQVNPPPFLILDETDAALDEANSKRYADMIKELGEKSQLIVITHNRATMAAAGELYGVTMGQDGVSKLLSVKFEEATKVAK